MIKHDNAHRILLRNQELWLLPHKAVYWKRKKVLMIADPHLGKTGHFRKNGIPVPGDVNYTNIQQLEKLLDTVDAQHLVILGDLFHSSKNLEWEQFLVWRSGYKNLEVTLVIGNHDILDSKTYHSSRINIFRKLRVEPFLLVHDVQAIKQNIPDRHYLLSGHIHPAIQLRGKGRQSMKLPCFYFGDNTGILPAFGAFTGTHVIKPGADDRIFTVVNDQVLPLHENSN